MAEVTPEQQAQMQTCWLRISTVMKESGLTRPMAESVLLQLFAALETGELPPESQMKDFLEAVTGVKKMQAIDPGVDDQVTRAELADTLSRVCRLAPRSMVVPVLSAVLVSLVANGRKNTELEMETAKHINGWLQDMDRKLLGEESGDA